MKIKIVSVACFPEKKCFKVAYEGRPVDTPKMKTYGPNIREFFSYKYDLVGRFTSSVGKEVDVEFDMHGHVDGIRV